MLVPSFRASRHVEHRQRRQRTHRCGTGARIATMDLTVSFAAWCPDCREAKRFLAKHNIPYKEIDVQTTPGAIEEIVKHTGLKAIPQFVIDGEWIQPYRPGRGFLYEEMSKRLGIKT